MTDVDLGAGPRVVACICARGGSKGVPRKNLRKLGASSLIEVSVRQALRCGIFDQVVASTDDPEMAEVAARAGALVPFLRPAALAEDTTNKWLVFRHLVRFLEAKQGRPVDILVDLDTGAALRRDEDIVGCVRHLIQTRAEVCVTAYESPHNPYYNLVRRDAEGRAAVCIPTSPPIVNRQQAPATYNLSPAAFAILRGALWEHEHWSQCNMRLWVIPRERALDVDSELDLQVLRALWSSSSSPQTTREAGQGVPVPESSGAGDADLFGLGGSVEAAQDVHPAVGLSSQE